MPDFSKRSHSQEIMDDLGCNGEVVFQTLRELDFINRWLGGNAVTMDAVKKLSDSAKKKSLSIADLGCGGGDILKQLAQWGKKSGIKLNLTGIDANPHIIEYARKNCSDFTEISFETIDIFSERFRHMKFDIIIGTLFYHHFQNDRLIEVFANLKQQAAVGFVINDIHRHWLAYYSIRALTGMFSKSSMVRYDAPLSVLRAFSKAELEKIFSLAGINHYDLNWRWAFRWQAVVRTLP